MNFKMILGVRAGSLNLLKFLNCLLKGRLRRSLNSSWRSSIVVRISPKITSMRCTNKPRRNYWSICSSKNWDKPSSQLILSTIIYYPTNRIKKGGLWGKSRYHFKYRPCYLLSLLSILGFSVFLSLFRFPLWKYQFRFQYRGFLWFL